MTYSRVGEAREGDVGQSRDSKVLKTGLLRPPGRRHQMILDPNQYECPQHHADLTSLVEDALYDDGPPVAYTWWRQKTSGPKSFRVIVSCPGASDTDAHWVTCTGKFMP
jgi:hypothetical protein